jgi:hypothetical protein
MRKTEDGAEVPLPRLLRPPPPPRDSSMQQAIPAARNIHLTLAES